MYNNKFEQLAHEIAEALQDKEALPLYLSYAKRFPEEELRKLLIRTLSIPADKIKRTRGALFTYLVGKYAERENGHSWY